MGPQIERSKEPAIIRRVKTRPTANAGTLDMMEVRRYFALLDREDLLEALQDDS